MPTIQLTNNTQLDITASTADKGATLNRYLKNPLVFTTPAGFESVAGTKIADADANAFPVTVTAAGSAGCAAEGPVLTVQAGATASVGLLKDNGKSDVFASLDIPDDDAVAALASFSLAGTLSEGDTASAGDFGFGINKSETVTLTSFVIAARTETLADALKQAISSLTIPRTVDDLRSLPENAICRIDGVSAVQFTASVAYSLLNNPLATLPLTKLPSFTVNATAGGTAEATVTDSAGHQITMGKLANGRVRLAVSRTKTDDLETSLTVSAGVTAGAGSFDALEFLIGRIGPNAATEAAKLKADLPAAQAQRLNASVKSAIDGALSSDLQISLKEALETARSKNRVFVYELDLDALDEAGAAALETALRGDFTGITGAGPLAGIRMLDSVLSITKTVTHTFTLHLLGIFNWASTNTFLRNSTINYTKDTRELVLSDQSIQVAANNLNGEKLREIVVKGITLTLPASANTPEAASPLNLVFFYRQASTSASTMRQFVNVLRATGVGTAARAQALLGQGLKQYGTSSLYLGLQLNAAQCRQLFLDSQKKPLPWTVYIQSACRAESLILAGDQDNADRLLLYSSGLDYWEQLQDAGAAPNIGRLLAGRGIRQNAVTDVVTVLWWASAMQAYANALAKGDDLAAAGKAVVTDGAMGFNEPWLILTMWSILGQPALDCRFTSSLLKQAAGAAT